MYTEFLIYMNTEKTNGSYTKISILAGGRGADNWGDIRSQFSSFDVNIASFRGAFLGVFAELRKAIVSLVMTIRSHGTCRLQLDGF